MSNLVREPELLIHALLGATLTRTFTLYNKRTKEPLPLAGWSPSLLIFRDRGGPQLFELTPANGLTIPQPATGAIELSIQTADLNLPAGDYWYRMRLIAGSTIWPIWPGHFVLEAQ